MAEITNNTKSENINETDPKVVFDPKIEKTVVAKHWIPENKNEEGAQGTEANTPQPLEDTTRVEGIYVPIIKINSIVVESTDIIYMNLNYTGFTPNLEIQIKKAQYLKLETPGMANKITVVMIPPVDKTYRKISLDFYVDSYDELESSYIYTGYLFFPPFEKKTTRSIKLDGKNSLNTYEFCKSIAAECQLGFAATKQCEDIPDTKIRLLRSQTLQDAIIEHTKFGGLDNNSIFDSWIDVYGYLVLCNVSWVLSKATKVEEISMHMLEGLNVTDSVAFKDNSIKYGELTGRTFTNWKEMPKEQQNRISSYEWIVNNYSIKSYGTNNTFFTINHKVTGGNNDIVTENITIEDKSADGQNYKDAYDFQDIKFLGVEMASKSDGNTPVLYQRQRNNAFIAQINAKQLKVVLETLNINLERGTLINIQIFEYDRTLKTQIINLSSNLKEKGDTSEVTEEKVENKNEILDNPKFGVPNYAISGIYYINGIEYSYKGDNKKIVQTLYLIKQTPANNYLNMSSIPKLTPNML